MLKKVFVITVLTLFLIPGILLAGNVASTANVKVMVDNKLVVFPDQGPYIDKNDRTMVPIRFIAEEMGAEVGWDGSKQLVTIGKDSTLIELVIGEKRAKVNGTVKTFDTSAVLYNSRTMVPLRFISEALGADADWDAGSKTVYIWTGAVPKEPVKPVETGVTPYVNATPVNPKDWVTADGTAEVMDWDDPVIKYVTMDELPHELNHMSILDITIDSKFVNVKFKTPGVHLTPNMFLAEGKDITRIRNYKNITPINETTYLQKYDIIATFDTHPDLGNLPTKADITKVTHFIFQVEDNQTRLLAVENPLYGGAK